jgi:hypothetical protein
VFPRRPPTSRRAIDDFAVDRHGVARAVTSTVPGGIVENREQPGPQIRPRLELIGGSKRFQIGFLDQVLGVGRPAGQPKRRAVQAVERGQRLGLERR